MRRLLIFAMIVLICFISLFATVTVYSRERTGYSKEELARLDAVESIYIKELKAVLADEGYAYSGVTMTKSFAKGENLSYEVSIHNRLFEKVSAERRAGIEEKLSAVPFRIADTDCEVMMVLTY